MSDLHRPEITPISATISMYYAFNKKMIQENVKDPDYYLNFFNQELTLTSDQENQKYLANILSVFILAKSNNASVTSVTKLLYDPNLKISLKFNNAYDFNLFQCLFKKYVSITF